MNAIFLDLGIIKIYWYSITMLLAILTGSFIFYKEARRRDLSKEFLSDLLFFGIIFGIIGARIYYCLFNLKYYLNNPFQILAVWNGGLAIHGAILGGALWFIYYSLKNKINPLKVLDVAAMSILISQAIGRWGNFFNQEAHGAITTYENLKNMFIPNFIINGMNINGIYYVPTFYFEFLWNLLGFIIIYIIGRKKYLKTGFLTGLYFMWYSFARFFIEGMRTDSLMLGKLRMAQLISVLLFALGLYLVLVKKKDTRLSRLKEKMESE